METKKITELPEATSFEGLVTLGVDCATNTSVNVPLKFVKDGADLAVSAAQRADAETAKTITATENANAAADRVDVAIENANQSAHRVDTAIESANTAIETAIENAVATTNTAIENANTATSLANEKASLADSMASLADEKASLADNMASLASKKASLADEKASLADEKASLADSMASLADEKASLADEKATLADTAAQNAISAGQSIDSKIESGLAALVDSAPATLDTLNELAAALGGDENFATTVTNKLAEKVDKTDGRLSDSRPASDVQAWAKATAKPTYTASEVGALAITGGTLTGDLYIQGESAKSIISTSAVSATSPHATFGAVSASGDKESYIRVGGHDSPYGFTYHPTGLYNVYNTIFHSGNLAPASTEIVANTLAQRDELGYLSARIFKDNWIIDNSPIGAVGYKISQADGFHRFCTPNHFKAQLGLWSTSNFDPATKANASHAHDNVTNQAGGAVKIWTGTQAQYNSVAKNADTLYFIQ